MVREFAFYGAECLRYVVGNDQLLRKVYKGLDYRDVAMDWESISKILWKYIWSYVYILHSCCTLHHWSVLDVFIVALCTIEVFLMCSSYVDTRCFEATPCRWIQRHSESLAAATVLMWETHWETHCQWHWHLEMVILHLFRKNTMILGMVFICFHDGFAIWFRVVNVKNRIIPIILRYCQIKNKPKK